MAFRTKPDFSAVWASLGDNTKPVDSYITNGWETVKPPRQYFNWIDNRQDAAIAYLYQAGIPEWDALVDYEGGAGVNSYSQGSDGKVYRCLADNGPNVVSIGAKDPANPLNSAFWTEAFGTKAAVDAVTSTVGTHTTQIGNGSGVTDAPAWRTALSVPSTTETVLDADFTGANQDFTGTEGFQKLPGGLIMQWGVVPSTADGASQSITFPTVFPSAVATVQITGTTITTTTNAAHWVPTAINTAGFTANYNATETLSSGALWFAVGF